MKTLSLGGVMAALLFTVVACTDSPTVTVAPLDALSAFNVTTVNGTPSTSCTELLAGQTIVSGDVCFEIVGETLNVTYTTIDGWELTEAHLWVGCSAGGYPQARNGNPKIGRFPYNAGDITGTTTHTFSLELAQFDCLDPIDCINGNNLYVMAHASVRKDNGDGTYQTETGWGDGDPAVDRGSWATVSVITLFDDSCGGPVEKCYDELGTAYAYDELNATCFSEFSDLIPNSSRWGWSNGAYAPGSSVEFDLYAGAGSGGSSDCVIVNDNGTPRATLAGTVTLDYSADGTTATVTYELLEGYFLSDSHVYVGCDVLPTTTQGDNIGYTVANGQIGSTQEYDNRPTSAVHEITGLTGCSAYVIFHASVLEEVDCQ